MRNLLAFFTAAAVAACLLYAHRTERLTFSGAQVLAADNTVKWFKGNLHTHSLWSDGDDYPEMVALWYKEHGYDFLSFSDHNTLHNRERWTDVLKNKGGRVAFEKLKARFPEDWVEERLNIRGNVESRLKTLDEVVQKIAAPGEFLLLQGEEISDHFRWIPIHMNATNLDQVLPPMGGDSVSDVMQRNTDALILAEHRMEALVEVLVGTAPGVVDTHRVVGRDRTVEEAPLRATGVPGAQPGEGPPVAPVVQDRVFLGDEVGLRADGSEHSAS
jgi:hypothetical protein